MRFCLPFLLDAPPHPPLANFGKTRFVRDLESVQRSTDVLEGGGGGETRGFAFSGVEGGEARLFWGHSLLMNLKPRIGGCSRRGEKQGQGGVSLLGHRGFLKGELHGCGSGSLSCFVVVKACL